jgi:hypothetical protein
VVARAIFADQVRDVDVDRPPLSPDLLNQLRPLDLVEAEPAAQRIDRPAVLGHAAGARRSSEGSIEVLRHVAQMQGGHGLAMIAIVLAVC